MCSRMLASSRLKMPQASNPSKNTITTERNLRGSIAMFDMLLTECADSSETARVVGDARRRREKVLEKIERRLRR